MIQENGGEDGVRDVDNRYRGLPQRTPDMLFRIIGKFYRGAVSHLEVIQERKQDTERAWRTMQETGDDVPLREALVTLFREIHFYVTCWLQIDLALYRLARREETASFGAVMDLFRPELERHLYVRKVIDDTERAVAAQFDRFAPEMSCVTDDAYWFDGVLFSVDETSVSALHRLYEAIQQEKKALSPQ